MCFFKSKFKTGNEDRELLIFLASFIPSIVAYVEDDFTKKKLSKISEKLHFLTPSDKSEVFRIDSKIKEDLFSLKGLIKFNNDGKNDNKIDTILINIQSNIELRNAKLN